MLLSTKRLWLRPSIKEDAVPIADIWCDADVTVYSGGPRDRQMVIDIVLKEADHPEANRWSVVLKDTGEVIGDCGLVSKEVEGKAETELIYYFAKASWGKGYATEAAEKIMSYAFNELKLKRVIALIHPDNLASEKVAERVGMTREMTVNRGGIMKSLFTRS